MKNNFTEINEGGRHEENKLGGVPMGIGNNGELNTVEENETINNKFVYSNRITLTPQVISQFNLPKSLAGKTAADATKLINNKFEGRNSKIDNNTKKAFLDRIAEAQETVKAEEQTKIQEAMQINSTEVPDMMEGQVPQGMEEFTQPQQQMFNGGELSQGLSMLGSTGAFGQHAGINQATTALDLGNTAFGKTGIDTSGATDVDTGSVKPSMMGVTGALKGAQAGAMFGPIGTGVGAAIGLGAGLIGGFKAKKDALKGHQNFEIGQSNKMISDFAFGGLLGEPVSGQPSNTTPTNVTISKNDLSKLTVTPENNLQPVTSRNRKMVGLQSGVFNDKRGNGYYYYYDKKPGDPGFNPEQHRDFVTEENHSSGQRLRLSNGNENPLYNYQLNNYLSANKNFAKGGNMYQGGGPFDKSTASYDPTKINLGLPQQQSNQFLDNLNYVKNLNSQGLTTLSPEQLQENNGYSNLELAPENVKTGYVSPYPKAKLGETLNKAGQYVKDNYGNALRYAPVAMNAYQLAKMGKPEVETLDRLGNKYNPQYMDERALTNQINAETNYTANALANASNGSLGSLSNNILGMQLNKTKGLSDAYSKIADVNRNEDTKAQQFNLGVDQFNVGQSNQEKDINARNRGAFKTERSKLLGQMGTDLGNIGKEEVYKKMAKEAFNYTWDGKYVTDNKGKTIVDPETNEPMTKEKYEQVTGKKTGKDYSKIFRTMNTDFGNLSLNNKNTKE